MGRSSAPSGSVLASARGVTRAPSDGQTDHTSSPADDRERLLEILRHNEGFAEPERWVEYARAHRFQPVRAYRLDRCPDCGTTASTPVGQYVYYSTLMTLRRCAECGLVYSDVRLDADVTARHFEQAYHDERYFMVRRRRIFAQLSALVARSVPRGGRVIDVGGAKGHLMAALRRRRPDVAITICDLSPSSCQWAQSTYGFRTVCGTVAALDGAAEPCDALVLSDVIYYEPDLPALWRVLPRIVKPGGSVFIRVPNKLWLIDAAEWVAARTRPAARRALRTSVPFFNPEHLYVMSRAYLTRRLRDAGFTEVRALPAEMLVRGGASDALPVLLYRLANAVHAATGGRVTVTPSMIVTARREG